MDIPNANKEIGYIDHTELVFSPENGIQSGGFSVPSIFMKSGMSPIVTMNTNNVQNGGSGQVSDLFQNLAVPNWATIYNMKGGEYKEQDNKNHVKDDSDSDSDIDDDLHDKLLGLVKEHENKVNKVKKNNKSKRIGNKDKKNITKKNKKQKKEDKEDK